VSGAPPRPRVVVADPIDSDALDRMRSGPCEVVDASHGAPALESVLSEAWALVVRSRTRVTRDLLGRAPRLSLIARAGVGVDNVDLAAAGERGIRVVNAPSAATTSVAELTVALCVLLVRDLFGSIASAKAGEWKRGTHGHELAGATVGFVGYGRIAREVARRLRPFGVSFLAFDPYVRETPDGTPLVDLTELLRRSRLVSLHAALTEENRHLIDAERLRQMPPGAYLINVARGGLVDEAALVDALESGRLAGAALDVFEVEPPTRRALLAHPRVLATPHLGASTHEAQRRAGEQIADEILRALRGEPLEALVNPGVAARA
jgi:D-3-phosphoglycerate dehydrogenase